MTKINIQGFGMKEAIFYEVEGTEDLLELEFIDNEKKYTTICNREYKCLFSPTKDPLLEAFNGNRANDYCFTYQKEETKDYYSYHVSKQENGLFSLVADIHGDLETKCRLVGTEKDEYWLIESDTLGIIEYSLYDIKNKKLLTPPFSTISFEQKKGPILAYYEIVLRQTIEEEDVILDMLVGFIDSDGNFATDLYSIENDALHDVRKYNFDKTFASFKNFRDTLTEMQRIQFQNLKKHHNEVIDDLFNNPYTKEEICFEKQHTKVIPFNRR